MRIAVFGSIGPRQEGFLDLLRERGTEVIVCSDAEELQGLSLDAVFVDEGHLMILGEAGPDILPAATPPIRGELGHIQDCRIYEAPEPAEYRHQKRDTQPWKSKRYFGGSNRRHHRRKG